MEGNPSFRVMTQLDPSLSMWFSDHLKNLRRRRCGDDDDDDDAPAEEKNMHAYMLALHRIQLHGMCNRTCSPYFMHVYARSPHMFPHGTHQELRLLNKVADEKNVVRKSFLGPTVIQFNINFCELIILYSKNESQYPIIYSMVLIPNPSRAYIPNHTASSCSEVCSLSPLGCSFQAGAFVAT